MITIHYNFIKNFDESYNNNYFIIHCIIIGKRNTLLTSKVQCTGTTVCVKELFMVLIIMNLV